MRLDLTGLKFGRLTVVKLSYVIDKKVFWLCRCECGKKTIVARNHLRSQHTRSCGCMAIDNLNNTTHGLSKKRIYRVWRGMQQRCFDKNSPTFKSYGARGIKCEWSSFGNFINDMYDSYLNHVKQFGEKNTSIDRINNNGNYSKSNCRWATNKEQANNTSYNHSITYLGQTLNIKQWSEKLGINYKALHLRITRLKWTTERALNTPIK